MPDNVNTSHNYRLGILATHPIQYYSPWFEDLSRRLDLHVYYAYRQDREGQSAAGFNVEFDWDIPLLKGYRYSWLHNVAKHPSLSRFAGCDTPELFELITSNRFDAFLSIGWNRKSCLQAVWACWQQRVPILMRGDSQLPMVTSRLKGMVKAVPYRWFLPKIDAHLYVGMRNREYLQHYGVPDDRLIFCPHFVDTARFETNAATSIEQGEAASIRHDLQIPQNAFVVLFVGRLIEKKNADHFVRAVMQAIDASVPIHGLIVGAGPLESELRRLASTCPQRIHFAGFQNQSRLPAYYAACDALVLPSNGSETWGLVVNEAMSCGKPCVVSSSCGCAPDLITNGETGFVFEEGNLEELRRMLTTLANRSLEQQQVMQGHLKQRMERYSMETASHALLATLERMTSCRV